MPGGDPHRRLDALQLSAARACAGALATALLALPGCVERRPDPAAHSTAPVEIRLPLGVDEVRGRLGALFAEGLAVRPPHPGSPGAALDWLACFALFDRPSAGSPRIGRALEHP